MSTKRIVITLSQQEFEQVQKESERLGFLPSTYAKYMTLYNLLPHDSVYQPYLHQTMLDALDALQPGKTFIVSSLFDPSTWRKLSPNVKRSLARNLSRIVDKNPDKYERTGEKTTDNTNIYRKR